MKCLRGTADFEISDEKCCIVIGHLSVILRIDQSSLTLGDEVFEAIHFSIAVEDEQFCSIVGVITVFYS